jgi:ribonuclease-3
LLAILVTQATVNDWDSCQTDLGVHFNDVSLLQQALVHRSYLNENPDCPLPDNERLEFLGDAVLNLIVAENLYTDFPKLAEGDLTMIRAFLVCRQSLEGIASTLGLGHWLLLGRGEEATGGRTRQSNLADAVEALIGAIYLDQGLAVTKEFVLKQVEPFVQKIRARGISPNYKALLQEFIQKQTQVTPSYHVTEATGPDHDRQFTVEVVIEREVLGSGVGKSKKAAEVEAARIAWEKLRCSHGQEGLRVERTEKG